MKKIFIAAIKLYQRFLSPLKSTKCPYFPTCSNYGLEAVERHGAIKGVLLTSWRILRCNPFSKGGCDPVPDDFTFKLGNLNKKNVKMRYGSK